MFERKVLYKAKNKKNEWIKGIPHIDDNKAYMIVVYPDTNCRSYNEEIDPDTLCEYTNKDTDSGSEIYENDLFLHEGKYWKITYSPELCGFQAVFKEEKTGFEFMLPIFHFIEEEIAGNAIDHPDMVNSVLEK